jgi:hypothetical protein
VGEPDGEEAEGIWIWPQAMRKTQTKEQHLIKNLLNKKTPVATLEFLLLSNHSLNGTS